MRLKSSRKLLLFPHSCCSRVDPVAILAASVMSAPAALAVSKIAYPETEESKTATGKRGNFEIPKSDDANIMHAATEL